MSTTDPTTTSTSRSVALDEPEDPATARDNAITYLQHLPPRDKPLTLSPGVVVTDHAVFRGRLIERLRSEDPGSYGSPLVDARLYRTALSRFPE